MIRSFPISDRLRPRIALVSTHGYIAAPPLPGAPDNGGQTVYVLELARKLGQLGYEVDLWTRQFEDQPPFEVISDRARIVRVPCGGTKFIPKEYLHEHLLEWSQHALDLIAQLGLRYQFVNSHYWDGGIAGDLLCAALGIPHIHTPHSAGLWKRTERQKDDPHDGAHFEELDNFSRRIAEETKLYAKAELIVATTPLQLDVLVNDYKAPPEKIRLIPTGYDDNRFFPVGEATRQSIRGRLNLSGLVVLATGRPARSKGHDLLIDAFTLVAKREPSAMLFLAIEGDDLTTTEAARLAELRQHAQASGHGSRIVFGSHAPDEHLADLYRAADLFVLPSRYEAFGTTAIEAMASGTPTVITVHGGLHRTLSFGRHALFADPFDREDLGITVAKVFRHPRLRTRLSTMGAHQARSLFTWTALAQQLIASVEHRPSDLAPQDRELDEAASVSV